MFSRMEISNVFLKNCDLILKNIMSQSALLLTLIAVVVVVVVVA